MRRQQKTRQQQNTLQRTSVQVSLANKNGNMLNGLGLKHQKKLHESVRTL